MMIHVFSIWPIIIVKHKAAMTKSYVEVVTVNIGYIGNRLHLHTRIVNDLYPAEMTTHTDRHEVLGSHIT